MVMKLADQKQKLKSRTKKQQVDLDLIAQGVRLIIEGIGEGVALGIEVGVGWIIATTVAVVALITPCPLSAAFPASAGVTV